MAQRWTIQEERQRRQTLINLYVAQNKTIGEVARTLGIGESTVYDRLIRLEIPSLRHLKVGYNNKRNDIKIPDSYSADLAEFVGILLGDGGINPTQIHVTINDRETLYILFIKRLIQRIFGIEARAMPKKNVRAQDIYFGSTAAVRYFLKMGLAHNKVKQQVSIPKWIFSSPAYQKACLRGLIDTDGSVCKLKFGVQISFTNRSMPLLRGAQQIFRGLSYHPSKISCYRFYLTKRQDLLKYSSEIGFSNPKHRTRFLRFIKSRGTEADKRDAL